MRISKEAWGAAAIWGWCCLFHLLIGVLRGDVASQGRHCLWLAVACVAAYWAGKWWRNFRGSPPGWRKERLMPYKFINLGPPEVDPPRICCSTCHTPSPPGYKLDITKEGNRWWLKSYFCPECLAKEDEAKAR